MRGAILIASSSGTVARIMIRQIPEHEKNNVSVTKSEKELLQKIHSVRPRLVLIEDCFSGCLTAQLLGRLIRRHPDLHITIFAISECHPFTAARYICWGAESFINLRDEENIVEKGITTILGGGFHMPENVEKFAENFDVIPSAGWELTEREGQILILSVSGMTIREIAEKLKIHGKTVRNHRNSIYAKINGKNLTDMIAYGIEKGILNASEIGRRA